MALGAGYIKAFDDFINGVLLKPASDLLSKVGSSLLAGLEGGMGGEGAGSSDKGEGLFGSAGAALGNWLKGGELSAPAPAREVPSMEISGPAPSMDRFEVSMAELGSFAPPAVGVAAARGVGAGMMA